MVPRCSERVIKSGFEPGRLKQDPAILEVLASESNNKQNGEPLEKIAQYAQLNMEDIAAEAGRNHQVNMTVGDGAVQVGGDVFGGIRITNRRKD